MSQQPEEEETALADVEVQSDEPALDSKTADPTLSPGEGNEVLERPVNDPTDPANDPFNASHEDHQLTAIRRETK